MGKIEPKFKVGDTVTVKSTNQNAVVEEILNFYPGDAGKVKIFWIDKSGKPHRQELHQDMLELATN